MNSTRDAYTVRRDLAPAPGGHVWETLMRDGVPIMRRCCACGESPGAVMSIESGLIECEPKAFTRDEWRHP